MLCVLGCSGNIASSLVRLLLDDSNHSLRHSSFDGLRLVSRQAVEVDSSAAATKGVRAIKVEVMIGDYLTDPTFLATAVEGCSAEAASFFGEEEREEGLSTLAFFCVVEFSASVILTSALE